MQAARVLLAAVASLLLVPRCLAATEPAPQEKLPAKASAPPAVPTRNVGIEIVLTHRRGGETASRKLTLIAGDGRLASTQQNYVAGETFFQFGAEVTPTLGRGRIALRLNLNFAWPAASSSEVPQGRRGVDGRNTLTVLLRSGEPLVVLHSEEPGGDRSIEASVTATLLE